MSAQPVERKMIRRSLLVAVVFVVLLVVVMGAMLFYLQIVQHSFYESRALAQQTMDQIVTPSRGVIYTRSMQKLAYSVPCYTIVLSPATMKDSQRERVAQKLSELLDVDQASVLEKANRTKRYYEVVKRKVDSETKDRVRAFISEEKIKGVSILEDTERFYPFNTLAANVIGFVNAENEGAYGLEASYNDVLSGTPGRIISSKNAKGAALSSSYEQYYEAAEGTAIVTTLDLTIQQILEKKLKQAYEANKCAVGTVGIVMEVKTGDILAMAQYPSYDLNAPQNVWDEAVAAEIEAMTDETEQAEAKKAALYDQWSIKPVSMTYEPGSVFKVVTAAVALEEKAVSLNDTFSCPGYFYVGKTRVACWKHGGHGSETFLDGLKNSCNPVFMQTALRIGTDAYYEYLNTTGITSKTGIDLQGEAVAITHTEDTFHELELAIASFGQRFKLTPLRLITTLCGIVNGGVMMQPRLVRGIADTDGNMLENYEPTKAGQIVSASTSRTICYMMEQVVAKGTGKNGYVAGYRVGGKTGTSEKLDAEMKEGETEADKRIASFCGIAPMDDPEIAVLVLLDEPRGALRQGGQIAGPVVGSILSEVLPYWGVEAIYTDKEIESAQVEVPSLVNTSIASAKEKLTSKRFKFEVVGSGSVVTAQLPAQGSRIPSGSTVILYCGESVTEEKVSMPSLLNMTYDQARLKLESMGLYLQAQGALQTDGGSTVKATSQTVPPGTETAVGTVVTVVFADMVNTAND